MLSIPDDVVLPVAVIHSFVVFVVRNDIDAAVNWDLRVYLSEYIPQGQRDKDIGTWVGPVVAGSGAGPDPSLPTYTMFHRWFSPYTMWSYIQIRPPSEEPSLALRSMFFPSMSYMASLHPRISPYDTPPAKTLRYLKVLFIAGWTVQTTASVRETPLIKVLFWSLIGLVPRYLLVAFLLWINQPPVACCLKTHCHDR